MRRPLLATPSHTGRPRKQPPADAVTRIAELAAEGFSVRGVAAGLGTSVDVLNRWMDENSALKEAFDAGRERERHALHNVLYRLATEEKDKISAMFLLKSRHGYREGDQGEQANRVSINFTLPGALKPDEFVEVVRNDASNRTK